MNRKSCLVVLLTVFVLSVCCCVLAADEGRFTLEEMRKRQGKSEKASYAERRRVEKANAPADQQADQAAAEEGQEPAMSEFEREEKLAELRAKLEKQPLEEEIMVEEEPVVEEAAEEPEPVIAEEMTPVETGSPLEMLPDDAVFAGGVNNFDKTMIKLDRYIADIVPMPMGISMLVKVQLAGIFGDPQLKGLELDKNIISYGLAVEDPEKPMQTYTLLPVASFEEFRKRSPNVGEPDANSVSVLMASSLPVKVQLAPAGEYVLMGTGEDGEAIGGQMEQLETSTGSFYASMEGPERERVENSQMWFYVDMTKAAELTGPGLIDSLTKMQEMGGQAEQFSPEEAAQGMQVVQEYADQLKSFCFTVNVYDASCKLGVIMRALPDTEIAGMFDSENQDSGEIMALLGMGKPAEMDVDDVKEVSRFIKGTEDRDFAGKYDLGMLARMSGKLPASAKIEKAEIFYSGTFLEDGVDIEIALPKDTLKSLMEMGMVAQPGQIEDTQKSERSRKPGKPEEQDGDTYDFSTIQGGK